MPRKNCWTIAEHAGDATPAGMQHLLSRASWDADEVRDDIRAGHAAIDRRLYVPRSWTQDLDRCRAARIPEDLGFATKPALATEMIARALDAGVSAVWVTGDEAYGGDPHLSAELERRQVGYLLAVSCKRPIPTRAGVFDAGGLARCLPKKAWQRLSAGDGAKGRRYDDWAQVQINDRKEGAGNRSLLVRRNRRTGELAFYRCYSAAPVPLTMLVRVAGRRIRLPTCPRAGASTRLVTLATSTPNPCSHKPLPASDH